MKQINNHDRKKDNESGNGHNSMSAVVTGVIVGAGVVATGAMVLKEKTNRDKIKKALTSVKEKIAGTQDEVEKVTDSATKAKKEVKKLWLK